MSTRFTLRSPWVYTKSLASGWRLEEFVEWIHWFWLIKRKGLNMLWTSGTSSFDSTARSHWGSNLRKTTRGAKLSCQKPENGGFFLDVRYSSTRLRCQKSIIICHVWIGYIILLITWGSGSWSCRCWGWICSRPNRRLIERKSHSKKSRERSEFAVFLMFFVWIYAHQRVETECWYPRWWTTRLVVSEEEFQVKRWQKWLWLRPRCWLCCDACGAWPAAATLASRW